MGRAAVDLKRPFPPVDLLQTGRVAPAPEMAQWIVSAFLDEDGPLFNPDHVHLRDARLGVLWQASELVKHGRRLIGRCELVQITGDAWSADRREQQIEDWFGRVPDFILAFDANYASACSDIELAALVDHELYHAAQARDGFNQPKFGADGNPMWAVRGHDIEEFVGVVQRYGAVTPEIAALVKAAQQQPAISRLSVAQACGTCALKAA